MKFLRLERALRYGILSLALGAAVFSCGCRGGRNPQANTDAAIRAAVEQHLNQQGNLNMTAMDMKFQKIMVEGDHAQAQVQFNLKQNNVSMEMLYDLERQNGAWVVTKSQPAGGKFQHPPMDKTHTLHP